MPRLNLLVTLHVRYVSLLSIKNRLKVKDANWSPKAPFTFAKGHKGRSLRAPKFTSQQRGTDSIWFKDLTASRFFQKVPAVVYSRYISHLHRVMLVFCKTGSGLLYTLRNLPIEPLSFYFYNYKKIVPTFPSTHASTQLLFIKVGSRISNIRDIFKLNVLFCTALFSTAYLKFFDRWSGFLTTILPSGQPRLFFFLSRADSADWGFFKLEKNSTFRDSWRIQWTRAGVWRRRGFRPKVRGVAMNPVDHPHGGRTKSIRFQQTPWGKPAKLK
jgi:hypothetical protein